MAFSSPPPIFANERAPGAGVTAVLGPTNTGKTHLAIERMLAHSSGVIGLPLRLLAREVYNKIVDRAGVDSVALITGEEKIKPPKARFWVSTVEAMPRDLDVSFLAVDEIQIAADLERGHVFTDRILHRRGRDETLLLGAATMRPIIERLLPGASIVTRPRLSQLEFAGDRKITRPPRRTAIVAFSAAEVYAIAELIKSQHGGAAVVLGSLSLHPQRPGGDVPVWRRRLPGRDRCGGMGLNLDVTTSPSPPTAIRRLSVPSPQSIRIRADRAGWPRHLATAPSAPPAAARRSSRNWSMRCRTAPSRA
jgi:ATP-dependent RNA helicase SUPV3L1/SUV3